ncbi:MAG: hypothetical protein ABFS45_10360 [Pseudomonadota bacterium]
MKKQTKKSSVATWYKTIVILFGVGLGALFYKAFDNYGAAGDFQMIGLTTGAALAGMLYVLMMTIDKNESSSFTQPLLWSLIIIPMFCWYLLSFINYEFDTSSPKSISAKVLEKKAAKRIKNGRVKTTYLIYVTSWKSEDSKERIHIKQDQFDKLSVGDTVYLNTKEGFLNKEYLFGPPDQIVTLQ